MKRGRRQRVERMFGVMVGPSRPFSSAVHAATTMTGPGGGRAQTRAQSRALGGTRRVVDRAVADRVAARVGTVRPVGVPVCAV